MRSGFAALAGRPNVGKSTLVNALTGEKVAIVSRVPHTTRHRIRGVWTQGDAQLVLVDLPGWQRPIDTLTERMQHTVEETIADDLDVIVLVLNARERIGAGDRYVARRVFELGPPVVIALNKIDRLKHGHVAEQMKTAATLGDFHALHPVSAKTRRATYRSPAPIRSRALRTRRTASRSSAMVSSTRSCIRDVSVSIGLCQPGRSTSTSCASSVV